MLSYTVHYVAHTVVSVRSFEVACNDVLKIRPTLYNIETIQRIYSKTFNVYDIYFFVFSTAKRAPARMCVRNDRFSRTFGNFNSYIYGAFCIQK